MARCCKYAYICLLKIPVQANLFKVETFVRNFNSRYRLNMDIPAEVIDEANKPPKRNQKLVPAKLCESFTFPEHVRQGFLFLPPVIRRVTDVFRARSAMRQLDLPPMDEDLVIEALSLPCATAGFNNQRLETLGDSVLKLCVVVHLFNAYPFRHEGACSWFLIGFSW
jgi:endoribonuclease Dicer